MTQERNQRPATPVAALACCGPLDAVLDADLFKALGDPTRLSLLACLAKCARPCSVTELAACCSVDLSVVSRHLALLERAGALSSERQGRTVLYVVRHGHLASLLRGLADALDECLAETNSAACCPPTGGAHGCLVDPLVPERQTP